MKCGSGRSSCGPIRKRPVTRLRHRIGSSTQVKARPRRNLPGARESRRIFFLQSTFNLALDISPADNQFLALPRDAVVFIEVITAGANNFRVCRAGVNWLTWAPTSKNSSNSAGAARSPWVSILRVSGFVAATIRPIQRQGHALQNKQEPGRCQRFESEFT